MAVADVMAGGLQGRSNHYPVYFILFNKGILVINYFSKICLRLAAVAAPGDPRPVCLIHLHDALQ
jgi:hypothetical protein